MGGNARALNRVTGKEFMQARKIKLKIFNRGQLVEEFKRMFVKLNDEFFRKYEEPIWEDFSIILDGSAFNGSSDAFFNNDITDEEFVKYKPKVGDIDVTVPKEKLHRIFELLSEQENVWLTENILYVGQNKKDLSALGKKDQINSVFMYKQHNHENPVQVDFEGVTYVDGKPNEWAKFGHSSVWEDIKRGYKGVNHKYILINATRAISIREDILIATDKAKIEKGVDVRIRKQRPGDIPRMYAFSVSKGLRTKYEQQFYEDGDPVIVDGKEVFKEKPTSESVYIQTVKGIFEILFKNEPAIDDLAKMQSFTGVVDLMEKHFTEKEVKDTFEYLVMLNLFGPVAQPLEVDDPKRDFNIKWPMVEHMFNVFPYPQLR